MQEGADTVSRPCVGALADAVPHGLAGGLAVGLVAAGEDTPGLAVACPDAGSLTASRWSSAVTGAFGGEAEGVDVCTSEVTIRLPGSRARAAPYAVFAGQAGGLQAVVKDHRPRARLVVPGR